MNNLMSVMGISAIAMGTYLCAEAVTEIAANINSE
ncbi:Uncharacterised protein [Macrococcoides caseolyticum]|nr:Uncharacterised protein [Macrococcus caseolyticus]